MCTCAAVGPPTPATNVENLGKQRPQRRTWAQRGLPAAGSRGEAAQRGACAPRKHDHKLKRKKVGASKKSQDGDKYRGRGGLSGPSMPGDPSLLQHSPSWICL